MHGDGFSVGPIRPGEADPLRVPVPTAVIGRAGEPSGPTHRVRTVARVSDHDADGRRPAVGRSLAPFLRERLAVTGQPVVRPVGDGSSNETLLVETPDRTIVLRRPPDEQPVPEPLHDDTREYDLLTALAETTVPVPTPVACCRDESVLGAPS